MVPYPSNATTEALNIQILDGCAFDQLFRFFHELSHAEDFLEGKIRISTLEACRTYEHKGRGDIGEATQEYNSGHISGSGADPNLLYIAEQSNIKFSGGERIKQIHISNCSFQRGISDAFVLCTSEHFKPHEMTVFGRYCVRIENPTLFFRLVSDTLHKEMPLREALMGRMQYTSRSYSGLQAPPGPLGFVKPAGDYADQREVRMLWTIHDRGLILNPRVVSCPSVKSLCALMPSNL